MNLREVRYQINFNYIKAIRRYLYDIENKIIEIFPEFRVQPTTQLPDEAEPSIERLVLLADYQEFTYILSITQVGFLISIRFNQTEDKNKESFNLAAKKILNFGSEIKKIFFQLIENFELSHEIFTSVFSDIYKNPDEFSNIIEFKPTDDELIISRTKEIEEVFFITEEKTARKVFDLSSENTYYQKNNEKNFLGYQLIDLFQISNRLKYNNSSSSDNKELQLSLEDIQRLYNVQS